MGPISIQGVDEQLSALLKQQAAKARTSVNQFILDTLNKHVGLAKEKKFTEEYDDLDHLFGSWSEEEFSEIQGAVSTQSAKPGTDPGFTHHPATQFPEIPIAETHCFQV